jgi:hypothetical protein
MRSISEIILQPTPLGSVILRDNLGMAYRFSRQSISWPAYGVNVVYAFATADNRIIYIGKADILSERLSGHERLSEARNLGAVALLVHEPKLWDPVPYEQAEERLIRAYCPVLNRQFNWLSALGKSGSSYPSLASLGMR